MSGSASAIWRCHPRHRRVAQGALVDQRRWQKWRVRVIYFHVVAQTQIRLLLIYRKGVKDDLTAAEQKVLRKLNADW